MSQYLMDRLNKVKENLIKWPDVPFIDKTGKELDPDSAFKVIEADLREILNKIIVLPEDERSLLKDTIEDFKTTMAIRQEEAEENLKQLREKVLLNQGATKAMKAYGKAFERQGYAKRGELDEPLS